MALFGNSGFYGRVVESTAPAYVNDSESDLMNLIIEKKFSNNSILLSKSDADLREQFKTDVLRKYDDMDIGQLPDQNEETVDEYYYEYETTVTRSQPVQTREPPPPAPEYVIEVQSYEEPEVAEAQAVAPSTPSPPTAPEEDLEPATVSCEEQTPVAEPSQTGASPVCGESSEQAYEKYSARLKDILRKNFKARNFMLGIEKALTELINSDTATSHEFPKMNTYFRMIVHHMCDLYSLEHNYDQSKQAIVASKKPESQIPEFNVAAFLVSPELETAAESGETSGKHSTGGSLKSDKIVQTSLSNLPSSEASGECSKAGSSSVKTTSTVTSPSPSQQAATKILKRDPNTPANKARRKSSREPHKTRTLEEKTAEYNRIKSRIFQSDASAALEAPSSSETSGHESGGSKQLKILNRQTSGNNYDKKAAHYQGAGRLSYQEKRLSGSEAAPAEPAPQDGHLMAQTGMSQPLNPAAMYYTPQGLGHAQMLYQNYQYQQQMSGQYVMPGKPMQTVVGHAQLGQYASQYGNHIYPTAMAQSLVAAGKTTMAAMQAPPPPQQQPQQATSISQHAAPAAYYISPAHGLGQLDQAKSNEPESTQDPARAMYSSPVSPNHLQASQYAVQSQMMANNRMSAAAAAAYPVGQYLNNAVAGGSYVPMYGQMTPMPGHYYATAPTTPLPPTSRAQTVMSNPAGGSSVQQSSPLPGRQLQQHPSDLYGQQALSGKEQQQQQRSRYRPQSQNTSAYYRETSLNPLGARRNKKPSAVNERSASSSKNAPSSQVSSQAPPARNQITKSQFKNMTHLQRTAYQLSPSHYQFNAQVFSAQMKPLAPQPQPQDLARNLSYSHQPAAQGYYPTGAQIYPPQLNRSQASYGYLPPPPQTANASALVASFMAMNVSPQAQQQQQHYAAAAGFQMPVPPGQLVQSTQKPFHANATAAASANAYKPGRTRNGAPSKQYSKLAGAKARYEAKANHSNSNSSHKSMSESSSSGDKPETEEPTSDSPPVKEETTTTTTAAAMRRGEVQIFGLRASLNKAELAGFFAPHQVAVRLEALGDYPEPGELIPIDENRFDVFVAFAETEPSDELLQTLRAGREWPFLVRKRIQ